MATENDRAVIGGNAPPDPIDEAISPHGDLLAAVSSWLDGTLVVNDGQMNAVDALTRAMKAARKMIEAARESTVKPLFDAHRAETARWKPTLDDWDMQIKALVSLVDEFKRKLAAEKAAEAKRQWEKADAARRDVEALVRAADAGNIKDQRAAVAAALEADIARAHASAASKDTVNGMRTVTHHEVTSRKALLDFICLTDRDAVSAFIDDWARKNYKTFTGMAKDGLRVWTEKEAY